MNQGVILLVEDNPSDVDLTRRAFERKRILNPLVVAEDGQEALDYLLCTGPHAGRSADTDPALILLDINLPKVSGLDVLRRIRSEARTKHLPVTMLTTSKEEQDLVASYDLCANSYIRKPVDFTQFAEVIGQLGLYWLVLNQVPPRR